MSQKALVLFILGKSESKVYVISLIFNILFLFVFLAISIALYFPVYRITEHEISHLDDQIFNPSGLWFFKIAMIGGGLWFLPLVFYLYREMKSFSKIFGTAAGFFYILSSLGMILIGFFPTYVSYIMHLIGAGFGFVGLLMAMLCTIIVVLLIFKRNFDKVIFIVSLVFYVPFLAVYISTIVLAGYPVLLSMMGGMEFGSFTPDGWYLLEWLMFLSGMYSTIGTMFIFAILLPKRLKR
jgi:hypothetical protein